MPRMDKLSNYRTTWTTNDAGGCVTYANTPVVEWTDKTVTLRSGGYETVTTKRKMNQAANQFGLGFAVWQQDWQWFVSYGSHDWAERVEMPFRDGMTFTRA